MADGQRPSAVLRRASRIRCAAIESTDGLLAQIPLVLSERHKFQQRRRYWSTGHPAQCGWSFAVRRSDTAPCGCEFCVHPPCDRCGSFARPSTDWRSTDESNEFHADSDRAATSAGASDAEQRSMRRQHALSQWRNVPIRRDRRRRGFLQCRWLSELLSVVPLPFVSPFLLRSYMFIRRPCLSVVRQPVHRRINAASVWSRT